MKLRKFIWVVTILWMGLIFYSSSRPLEVSREDSAWLMEKMKVVETKEEALDLNNQEAMSLQMWVRKSAHVIIFAGLGILLYISFYGYMGKSLQTGFFSWIAAVLYGGFDEWHQSLVGRGAQWADVVRDAKGAFWGCLAMTALFLLIENIPSIYKWINRFYRMNVKEMV